MNFIRLLPSVSLVEEQRDFIARTLHSRVIENIEVHHILAPIILTTVLFDFLGLLSSSGYLNSFATQDGHR